MIKRTTGTTLVAAAALALLAACGDAVGPNPTDVDFDPSLGIDLDDMTQTASGLYIRDDSVGVGAAAATGDQVTVAYTGWLADGTQFDTSDAFPIPSLGAPGLIDGFTECVIGMSVGGIRTCVLPSSLGYGSQGQGVIQGGAVILFEMTLNSLVKPQT